MTRHTATPPTEANSADDFECGDRVRVHVDDYPYGWSDYYEDAGREWIVGDITYDQLDPDGDLQFKLDDPPDDIRGEFGYAKPEDLEHC